MSDGGTWEALDGLVAAVSAATGSAEPPWLEAYRSIIGDEFLDRHHVGLTVGLIRSSEQGPSQAWIEALAHIACDPMQRWTLEAFWALATRSDELPEPPENDDPFMARLACDLQAFVFAERGDAAEVMALRRACFEAWRFEDTDQQIYLGLDLFDDLLVLDRIEEAAQLLSQLDAMIAYVGYPEMQAELLDREADLAREFHDHARAKACYEEAKALLDGDDEGQYERLGLWTARINMQLQQGNLQRARELLEIPHRSETYPLIARCEQRRLTSLCQLYTTIEDKRSLYVALKELVESVITVNWSLFGTLDSHIDDLINLACQFGEGDQAKAHLERGKALLGDKAEAGWLNIAAVRIALWEERESEVCGLLAGALHSPLMTRDIFFCQTLVTLIDEYGGEEEQSLASGALDRCIEALVERKLHVRASNGLQYKAQNLMHAGEVEAARGAFKASVKALEEPGLYRKKVVEAAMDWATWEINGGHLDKLEEPIGLVIAHSDDEAAPTLMGRLSFQQAMYFAMNPGAGESEEDPKAVVGRWIALAADQYLEGNRLSEASSVYMHLADWLDSQGEYQAATEILESVAQGALSAGDTELIWHAALLAANRLEHEGKGHAAVQLLKNTLESCESDNTSTRGAQHYEIGNLLNVIGSHDEALEHYRSAKRYLVNESVQDRSRVLLGLGISHWHRQEEDKALDHWRMAFDLALRCAERDFVSDIAQGIDNHLIERLDRVGETRIALLEEFVAIGERCRWQLIAKGSDLPLRLAEEYAHAGREGAYVAETVETLKTLADAVTTVGLAHDGTLLLQRAAGIELLSGHHESGLSLMREVLERTEARSGRVVRAREGLLQATMVAAGGLIHEAWDRVSEVRDWLATVEEGHDDEEALDELTLTCQLQCANLHMLGEKPELVTGPLTELIATCDASEEAWPAAQLARVTLAAAYTALGQEARASDTLKAIEANLDQSSSGWFNAVIMAGRIGQRALGEAILRGVQDTFGRSAPARWSSTQISLQCGADWLAFTSGEAVDKKRAQEMAARALSTRHFNLATIITLLVACYANESGDRQGALEAVSEAVETARQHWSLDEFGLMWGVLLPPELKQIAAGLLEADRLQHVH